MRLRFKLARGAVAIAASICLLSGYAASTKTFYANPAKVRDTQLCRTYLEAAPSGNPTIRLRHGSGSDPSWAHARDHEPYCRQRG
jgi:hypothetical protein